MCHIGKASPCRFKGALGDAYQRVKLGESLTIHLWNGSSLKTGGRGCCVG